MPMNVNKTTIHAIRWSKLLWKSPKPMRPPILHQIQWQALGTQMNIKLTRNIRHRNPTTIQRTAKTHGCNRPNLYNADSNHVRTDTGIQGIRTRALHLWLKPTSKKQTYESWTGNQGVPQIDQLHLLFFDLFCFWGSATQTFVFCRLSTIFDFKGSRNVAKYDYAVVAQRQRTQARRRIWTKEFVCAHTALSKNSYF
jgi:hypothetical protein